MASDRPHKPRHARRGASSGLADLLLSQAYPILSSLLVTFFTAKLLGPSGRGSLTYFTATFSLGGAVSFLSLHVGAAHVAHEGKAGPAAALRLTIWLHALGAVLVGCATYANFAPTVALFYFFGIFFSALNLVVLRTIQALGDNRHFRRSWAIQSLGYAALALPVALLTRSWQSVLTCWFVSLAFSTFYSLRHFYSLTPGLESPRPPVLLDVLARSTKSHVGTLGMQFLFSADIVILGAVAPRSEVGIYGIAFTAIGLVWNVAEAFSLKAMQRPRGGNVDTPAADGASTDRRLFAVNGLVSVGLAAVICLASWLFIDAFLPEFRASVPLIWILAPGVVIQSPARIALASLQRRAHFKSVMIIGVTASLLALGYIPAARAGGAQGLAVASTTAYFIVSAVTAYLWLRSTRADSGIH